MFWAMVPLLPYWNVAKSSDAVVLLPIEVGCGCPFEPFESALHRGWGVVLRVLVSEAPVTPPPKALTLFALFMTGVPFLDSMLMSDEERAVAGEELGTVGAVAQGGGKEDAKFVGG